MTEKGDYEIDKELGGNAPDTDNEDVLDTIDLIASGYEWTCPWCNRLYQEIEAKEKVYCKFCLMEFETNPPDHAYG